MTIDNKNAKLSDASSLVEFYDMIHEEDLFEIMEILEKERSDGWIFLYKSVPHEGYVNVCCSPNIDMARSLFSRMSRAAHEGYKITDSVFVENRLRQYKETLDRAKPLASEVLENFETHQWFKISDDDAITALRAKA